MNNITPILLVKKTLFVFLLLILPIFFYIGLIKYKDTLGEYYLGRNCDPSYPYLTNALNLAQVKSYGVGLIAHPGTPVQELGAAVLLFVHSYNSKNTDIVTNVFNNPEYFLNKILKTFLFIISAAIFLLGLITYIKLKSIFAALFLQLSPFAFYSEDIYFQLTNVSVEPILVFTAILIISTIILFLNKSESGKNNLIYTLVFGLLCGLGMATKISFLPVMIIPFLLLKPLKYKGLFILFSIVSFCVFVYPAFSSNTADEFTIWVRDLITHSGKYGKGSEDIIESSVYFVNIKTIFSKNLVFSVTYISMLVILILQFFGKYKSVVRSNKYFILMLGIFLAMSLQILMVAKHFSLYYMIPVYMFSILGLFVIYKIFISFYPDMLNSKKGKYIFYSFISVIMISYSVIHLKTINKERKYIGNGRNEARKIVSTLEEDYENSIVVSTYECSSKQFALYLGSFFGGTQHKRYMSIVKEKYPNNFYFNRWDNNFYDEFDINYIKDRLIEENKFIFQGVTDEVTDKFMENVKELTGKPNATYRKIISNYDRDGLYEITLE
jgi:hypothetical protein